MLPCLNDLECTNQQNEQCINGFCQLRTQNDAGPQENLCIPTPETCNGKDDDCDGQTDEGLRCAAEGEECDPKAAQPIGCQQNLECVSFYPDRPRICLLPCQPNQPDSCADNRDKCVHINGRWACLQTGCTTENDCKYNSKVPHECVSVGGGTKYCLATYPDTGALVFGRLCSPPEQQYCLKKYRCMRKQDESKGFCTLRCGTDDDCKPDSQNKAICRPLGAGDLTKICSFPCGADTDCPSGMTCNLSSKICQVGAQ